jgi:hypothetical protein
VRFELGNLFFVGRITLDNNGNYIVAEIQTLDPSTEVLLQRVIHSLPFLANNPLPEAKALMKQGLVILKGKSNIETGNIENTVERWPFSNAEKVYGHHKNTSNPEIRKLIQEQAQFLIEEAMRLKEEVNYKMVRNKKFY